MIAELLNTEITDLSTLSSMPVGAVVIDDDGMAWQLDWDGNWRPASGIVSAQRAPSLLSRSKTQLLVWLPPEATQ